MVAAGWYQGGVLSRVGRWVCLWFVLGGVLPAAAQDAWVKAAISPGLQAAGHVTQVAFEPVPGQAPAGAVVRRVLVTLDAGAAQGIEARLCGGRAPVQCLPVSATGALDTRVFDGLPAAGPFWLAYRVLGQRPLSQPRHVRSQLIVWFDVGS